MGEMELCRRRVAAKGQVSFIPGRETEHSPIRMALMFLYELSGEIEEDPVVFQSGGELELVALFRGACCRCGDLLASHSNTLALLSACWKVELCGTVGGPEVGKLSIWPEGAGLCWEQSNVSGHPFDELSDLCVKLKVETQQELEFLIEVLGRLSFRTQCIAVPKRYEKLCVENALAKHIDGARFCYLPMLGDVEPEEALESLSVEQKEVLWSDFLENGLPVREFEWAWAACRQGETMGLLEWELALRLALLKNEIQVINTESQFKVLDREGKAMRFSAASPIAAERLFLKILFPAIPAC